MKTNWSDNLTDIEKLGADVISMSLIDEIRALAFAYLDHSAPLFAERLANGFVRDGHGDLTAQDIFCLDNGPRIIDCLAFDARLRIGDVLLDMAFLAMDAERLAGAAAAEELWRQYAEFPDEHHPRLSPTTSSPTGPAYGQRSPRCALLKVIRSHSSRSSPTCGRRCVTPGGRGDG